MVAVVSHVGRSDRTAFRECLVCGPAAVMVLAAVAGESGSNGSFEATSLAATGSWSVGGSTGGFQWSYPLAVPVAGNGGGLSPTIEFGYSSSRVDGRVASSNNQPGWIGQGFDYDPGFVERSYQPCRDTGVEEMEDSGELCWAGGDPHVGSCWESANGWSPTTRWTACIGRRMMMAPGWSG